MSSNFDLKIVLQYITLCPQGIELWHIDINIKSVIVAQLD